MGDAIQPVLMMNLQLSVLSPLLLELHLLLLFETSLDFIVACTFSL